MKKFIYFLLTFSLFFSCLTYSAFAANNTSERSISSFLEEPISPNLSLGYTWPNTPCDIFFKCDFPYYQREAVRAAMQQWNVVNDLYGHSIVSMFLTTGDTDNFVVYTSTIGYAVAQTSPYVIGGDIYEVTIMLNSMYNWSVGASSGCYDIQSVVLHELGHALGVAHCHQNGASSCFSDTCAYNVMQPTISMNMTRRTFQEYDTASYIVIY